MVNRTYTADNMPASITNLAVGDYAYSWDENKNKTGETVTGAMTNFSSTMAFDNQNRLTAWNRTNGDSQSWQLSPVNDWQSVTTNGTTQTRTHGPTHEVLTVGPAAIQHDSRGNITVDDAAITRTYDADNKVSQATVPAGSQRGIPGTHTYHFDALGRRIRKTTGGTTPTDTIFVHSGSQIIADYPAGTAPASPQSTYIWGSYIDELVFQHNVGGGNGGSGPNPTDLYPHRNQQYSTTAVTDQTGAVVERYAYTSYGDLTTRDPNTLAPRTTNPFTRYTYTGREHDPETGSYHFRNRDYLGSLGRFNSHDPILYPDGWNTFAGWFALWGIDPAGLASKTYEVFDMRVDNGHTINTVISEITVTTKIDAEMCEVKCGECVGDVFLSVKFEWKALTDDVMHRSNGMICNGKDCSNLWWDGKASSASTSQTAISCSGGVSKGQMHVMSQNEKDLEDFLLDSEDPDGDFKKFRADNTVFRIEYNVEIKKCGETFKDEITLKVAENAKVLWPPSSRRIREKR